MSDRETALRKAAAAVEGGRHEEGAQHYAEALAAGPDSGVIRFNLGLSLAFIGRRSEATASLREAARLEENDADALAELGRLEIAENRLDAAADYLDEALRRVPRHAGALNNRGVVHFLKGEYSDAAGRFEDATVADPGSADAWYNLADALDEIGDRAGATRARKRFEEL